MENKNFLARILAHKKSEVAARQQHVPLEQIREKLSSVSPPLSLAEALSQEELAVIAEIKKASPSAGLIREHFDPLHIAKSYMQANAHALSVLTDEQFFQGSLDYVTQIRPSVTVPILRKDFIIDSYQILEARAAGADALLLIVAALEKAVLRQLLEKTHEIGMEALVEVHSEAEMETALEAGAEIIGINNRNLETFKIDLATTEQLVPLAPEGTVIVGESGLHTAEDIQRMLNAGVDAVLIGTHFMKHPEPGIALQEFLSAAKEHKEAGKK